MQYRAPPPSARLWPRHLLRIVRSDASRLPSIVARMPQCNGTVPREVWVRRLGALEDGGLGLRAQAKRVYGLRVYGLLVYGVGLTA